MIADMDPFADSRAHDVSKALSDNPHILNSPQLASDVAKSTNPQELAPILTHSALSLGTVNAASDHVATREDDGSWWHSLLHGAVTGLETLVKPLKEVQRDYKFVHSVFSRHGVLQGTIVALGVIGGGVAGAFVGGPEGAIIGSEMAATGLRKLASEVGSEDSVADSENENYKVSVGRDVANLMGAHGHTDKGQGWGSAVSWTVDAVADITFDPLMVVGKIPQIVRNGKYLVESGRRIPIALRFQGAQDFLATHTLRLTNADNLDKLWNAAKNPTIGGRFIGAGRRVRRAYEEIANITDVGVISQKLPMLSGLADELASANTVDAVHEVFMRTFKEHDLMARFATGGAPIIPNRTIMRSAVSKMADKLRQPGWGNLDDTAFNYNNAANFIVPKVTHVAKEVVDAAGNVATTVERKWILPVALNPFSKEKLATAVAQKVRTASGFQPWSISADLSKISSKSFDPGDPATFKSIFNTAYFSMGHKLAQQMTTRYIDSGSFVEGRFIPGPETHNIWLSIQSEVLNAMGFPNDPKFISETLNKIGAVSKGTVGGNIFGIGKRSGVKASYLSTDAGTEHMALYSHQTNKWMYPDFRTFKRAARDLTTYGQTYGKLENVAYKFMTNVWNPMALATGGFGLRVAASELIPTLIRFGTIETVKGNISKAAASMRHSLLPGEDEDIMSFALLAHAGEAASYTNPTKFAEFLKQEAANTSGKKARQAFYNFTDKFMSEQSLERAAKLAIFNRGHMATGSTIAGHYGQEGFQEKMAESIDVAEQMLARGEDPYLARDVKLPRKGTQKATEKFKTYSPIDHHFDLFWATNLQKASQNVAQQAIARDILDAFATVKEEFIEPKFKSTFLTPEEFDILDRGGFPSRLRDESFDKYLKDAHEFIAKEWIDQEFISKPYLADMENDLVSFFELSQFQVNMLRKHGVVPLSSILKALKSKDPDKSAEFVSALIQHGDLGATEVGVKGNYIVPDSVIYREAGEFKGMAFTIGKSKTKYVSVDWYPSRNAAEEFARTSDQEAVTHWEDEKSLELIGKYLEEQYAHDAMVAEMRAAHEAKPGKMPEKLTNQQIDDAFDSLVKREYARILGREYDPKEFNGLGSKLSSEADTYAVERGAGLERYAKQDLIEFAHARVDDMLNLLTGNDNTLHHEFAQLIADGRKVKIQDVLHVGIDSKPLNTFGQELVPFYRNAASRYFNGMFDKVIDPIINHVSREPMFFQHYNQMMDLYDPMVESGLIDAATGVRLAMQRATHAMVPQIHNVEMKSQFSLLSRYVLPFYFAQEQAVRRFGNLQREAPHALRTYQVIEQAQNNPAFTTADDQGNRYVAIPGVGELGAALINAANHIPGFPTVTGMHVNVQGNLVSLKSVLPEIQLPAASPILTIPLNVIAAHFPGFSEPVKSAVGRSYRQSVVDALLPSAPLKNFWRALTADEQDSVLANSMISSISASSVEGKFPASDASPKDWQDFHDRIRHNAISLLIIKGFLGMFSPLSPKVDQEKAGLRQEFQDLLNKEKLPYAEAWLKFSNKHGKGAISYTISKNSPTTPGLRIPYTEQALQWISKNESLVTGKHATGAVFLIPQLSGKDADHQVMATELLRLSLLQKNSPEKFMTAVAVASGNNEFYAASDKHDAEIKKLTAAGDVDGVNAQQAHFDQWKQNFIASHPVWNQHYAPDASMKASLAKNAYYDLKALFDSGKAPKGRQTDLVKGLMQDYDRYKYAKNNHGWLSISDINQQWNTYLDEEKVKNPELKSIINTVFKRLP